MDDKEMEARAQEGRTVHRITVALSDDAYKVARARAAERQAGAVSLILEELLEVCFGKRKPGTTVVITLHFHPAYWQKARWQKILEGLGAAPMGPTMEEPTERQKLVTSIIDRCAELVFEHASDRGHCGERPLKECALLGDIKELVEKLGRTQATV